MFGSLIDEYGDYTVELNLRSSVPVTLTIPVMVTMSPGTQLSTKTITIINNG